MTVSSLVILFTLIPDCISLSFCSNPHDVDDTVAVVGFHTTSYIYPEHRPQKDVRITLFSEIVAGKSVTVSIVEQSTHNVCIIT